MGRSPSKSERKRGRLWLWFRISGLTYKELAERTGYSPSTVCCVVNGKRLKRPFSRSCRGKIVATLVWFCRKAGRDPRFVQPIATIKCACGRVHIVYSTNGTCEVSVLTKSTLKGSNPH
ncbi:hypothetical protein GG496_002287 [Candidatus Fervidibacteria bacterium JGI MDM2 JNZ-1-D12]